MEEIREEQLNSFTELSGKLRERINDKENDSKMKILHKLYSILYIKFNHHNQDEIQRRKVEYEKHIRRNEFIDQYDQWKWI